MLCYLVGLKDPDHAAAGPLGGAIFETAVLLEIVKAFVNRGEESRRSTSGALRLESKSIWLSKPAAN